MVDNPTLIKLILSISFFLSEKAIAPKWQRKKRQRKRRDKSSFTEHINLIYVLGFLLLKKLGKKSIIFLMQINIKATGLDLTPAVREYIENKIGSLDKFLKRFEAQGEVKAEIEIARTTRHHRKGNVFYAETNLYLPKRTIRAEHSDWDVRAAINMVKDKLKLKIQKYKGLSLRR